MNKVVVLGSSNMDIVISSDRLPQVGETIIGENINYFVGGKGANQAVAAKRAGANTTFLSKVGDDTFGEKILTHLQREGLDLKNVEQEKNLFTGIASIFKLPEDNCITVISGTNELIDKDYINRHNDIIKGADVLLVQLEIPISSVDYALKLAKSNGVTTVLNPAPFHEEVANLLENVDYLTPNETEFASLMKNDLPIEVAMLDWQKNHETRLLVTRGEKGVSYVENGKVVTIPAFKMKVRDTTGAGDTFNGVLAGAISQGKELAESIRIANAASALSVTKLGAQTGMPDKEEIFQLLGNKD